MVNDQFKKYTIKELTEVLGTVDNVVRKKVKKYQFSTTQEMINGRSTTVVELNNDQLKALIHEIEFNKQTYKSENTQSMSDQQAVNYTNTDTVNSTSEIIREVNKQKNESSTGDQLVKMLAEYAEKAGKYELLEDKSKEERENTKYWQDKYFECQNEIKELIKLNSQLEFANKNQQLKIDSLKEELETEKNKKPGFLGMFRK